MARRLIGELFVAAGPDAGKTFGIADNTVLGRDAEADVVLADRELSRRHARIRLENGGAVVEDLGSTNGTYLGQRKIDSPVPLEIGVPLRIGKTVLELR